jgi:hypothetical protein
VTLWRWPVLLMALVLTGCGTGSAERAAARAADRFESAVASHDLAGACALLSDDVLESFDEPCQDGLQQARLAPATGPSSTEVFGQNGLVRWSHEAVFVSRFPDGWKVVAAGCTRRPDRPYDCSVSGG